MATSISQQNPQSPRSSQPFHLSTENRASSISLNERTSRSFAGEGLTVGEFHRSSQTKIKGATQKPFPTMAFFILFVVDIIDIFLGMTWVLSILFNITIGLFVSKYVMGRISDYKKTVDNIIALSKKGSRAGGKSLGTKMTRVTSKIIKKVSGDRIKKKTQKKILFFIFYGIVPILQIFASWAFFLFMYYKQEKRLVKDINEAAKAVAQAQANQSSDIQLDTA